MKYCPNCGTPAEDMQAFCINCGCKLPEKPGNGNSSADAGRAANINHAANTNKENYANASGQNPGGQGYSVPGQNPPPQKKGLVKGIGIGLLAALVLVVVIALTGGNDKKPYTSSAEASAGISEVSASGESSGVGSEGSTATGTETGSVAAFEADSQAGSETGGTEESEKIPLKQGVIEGNNAFVYDNKLVFFPYKNMLWSALIAGDGTLYDFCQDATFADNIQSVAVVGTDLIVGTSDTLYKTDMNTYQSGSGKLEKIIDKSIDEFFVYEGYVYYKYGYSVYRVPMQGGEETVVAKEARDCAVTNQGIFISDKDGAVYWISYDGGEQKRLVSASNKETYLSAGDDCIYIRYKGSPEVGVYKVSDQEQGTLSLPGWTGEYASIYPIWEISQVLIYEGEVNKAYRYDLAAGSGRQIGENSGLPTSFATFAGDTCYWSTQRGINWYNTVSGAKDSYDPGKDGGQSGSSGGTGTSQSDSSGNGQTGGAGGSVSTSGSVIETELFSVTVPESWAGKVTYKIYEGDYQEYSLHFYQKSSQDAQMGGHLFGISLYMDGSEELEYLPEYEKMGRLIYRPAEVYVVVAEYPTDVQFTQEGEAEYHALQEDIKGILDTFTVNSTYEFKKE